MFFISSCKVQAKLPVDAVVLDTIIYTDEVQSGQPQTVEMPDGTVFTYKMPEKVSDRDVIKIKQDKNGKSYYIRVKLVERNGQESTAPKK